jgi:hypothetical protein
MSEEEEEERLVGTPCPVAKCKGYVKYDPQDQTWECDRGHSVGGSFQNLRKSRTD